MLLDVQVQGVRDQFDLARVPRPKEIQKPRYLRLLLFRGPGRRRRFHQVRTGIRGVQPGAQRRLHRLLNAANMPACECDPQLFVKIQTESKGGLNFFLFQINNLQSGRLTASGDGHTIPTAGQLMNTTKRKTRQPLERVQCIPHRGIKTAIARKLGVHRSLITKVWAGTKTSARVRAEIDSYLRAPMQYVRQHAHLFQRAA